MEFLRYELFWGNEVWQLIAFFTIILLGLVGGKFGKYFLLKRENRYNELGRPISEALFRSLAHCIAFFAIALGIYCAFSFLRIPPEVIGFVDTTRAVLVWLAIGYTLYWLVEVPNAWILQLSKRSQSKMHEMFLPIVRKTLRLGIMLLIGVQIATIISDQPVTSIIAGLGIGGLAVALAAQDTIKNFFGSLVIFADKPFELGERITIDAIDGTIESVGLRSTRIRTLDGHLVTYPNGELANKVIRTISRRPYIRRTMNVTITYDTPPEKIDRATEILKDILKDKEEINTEAFPPRVVFNELNSDSLNILVIYWYFPPNWWDYLYYSEWVNKELIRRFNDEGIDFAFPSQTMYLAGDSNRPLKIGLEGLEALQKQTESVSPQGDDETRFPPSLPPQEGDKGPSPS